MIFLRKSNLWLIFLFGIFGNLNAQQNIFQSLQWAAPEIIEPEGASSFQRLHFQGAVYESIRDMLPVYQQIILVPDYQSVENVTVIPVVVESLSPEEELLVKQTNQVPADFQVEYHIFRQHDKKKLYVTLMPVRKQGDVFQRLTDFYLSINYQKIPSRDEKDIAFRSNAVLAEGQWLKFRIQKDGIYKLTYSELQANGVDVANLDLERAGIFGNTGMLLPEMNEASLDFGLKENPVQVVGGEDGSFDPGDYFMFFGKGPVQWKYYPANQLYEHIPNPYNNFSYYFFTPDQAEGLRVEALSPVSGNPEYTITDRDHLAYYEKDEQNLIESGRVWYGEILSWGYETFEFPQFEIPHAVVGKEAVLVADVAIKSTYNSSVYFRVNQQDILQLYSPSLDPESHTEANTESGSNYFEQNGNSYVVEAVYDAPSNSSKTWINWVEIQGKSRLVYEGSPLFIRNKESLNYDLVEYAVSDANHELVLWDISNPVEPTSVSVDLQGDKAVFRSPSSELHRFVAFQPSQAQTPEFVEEVENQNLHAIRNIDYLIISHPDFLMQARQLGDFHLNHDGLTYEVVVPEKIYNEFSSGGQDVSGIRNFVRHVYQTSDEGKRLRFLMLFGDASYDMLDRLDDNTNYIPSFQSYNSNNITSSYVSDDYFGLLDEGEGNTGSATDDLIGFLDIGIGRFPAETAAEAQVMVDKVLHYASSSSSFGSWRNDICLLSDDEDSNMHFIQSELLSEIIDTGYRQYNLEKIYIDAYRQVSTPGGQRYPDVNNDINSRMAKGALVMNYTGHGGEVSLADERIMTIDMIEKWGNYDAMPLFVTATCEFSRFDNPAFRSAGERVLHNPNGGGIALLTTSRLAYSYTNSILNVRMFHMAFRKEAGVYPRLGDIMVASKTPNGLHLYNFVLLGDPALQLAYPDYKVETTHVNGTDVHQSARDTVKALSHISIKGAVTNDQGQILTDFNGTVEPVIYDKAYNLKTRANDPKSYESPFKVQNSVIYKGEATVENGVFEFSFITPKDINYDFDVGKISYYAWSENADATGSDDEMIIGGSADVSLDDTEGPAITLFMNDRRFEPKGLVNDDPMLIADLHDQSGINTLNNGVGHDISVVIDGDVNHIYSLNEYYSAARDSYQDGSVYYVLNNLEPGMHSLTVKAWDVLNNSSSKSVEFEVAEFIPPHIESVYNYPNPFVEATTIMFMHNQFNEQMDVEVLIHSLDGRLVKRLGPVVMQADGYFSRPLTWYGDSDTGRIPPAGLYVISVVMDNEIDSRYIGGGKVLKMKQGN
jgi:hypothetical protein